MRKDATVYRGKGWQGERVEETKYIKGEKKVGRKESWKNVSEKGW